MYVEKQYVLYGQRPVYACGDKTAIDDEVPIIFGPSTVVRGFDVLNHWWGPTARVVEGLMHAWAGFRRRDGHWHASRVRVGRRPHAGQPLRVSQRPEVTLVSLLYTTLDVRLTYLIAE